MIVKLKTTIIVSLISLSFISQAGDRNCRDEFTPSYETAQRILKEEGIKAWSKYQANYKRLGLPSAPKQTYKEDWVSWEHFMGIEVPSFEEARKILQREMIRTQSEYQANQEYLGLPFAPKQTYKENWKGLEHFLGNETLSFENAQRVVEKKDVKIWPKKVIIKTDGACRGNPGPCSLGLQVFVDSSEKELVYEEGVYLEDHNTNNFSEYKAMIRALELAVQKGVQELTVLSDSKLVIKQLNGEYKVKQETLKLLFEEAQNFIKQIPSVDFQHIPREQNKGADALANKALDERK